MLLLKSLFPNVLSMNLNYKPSDIPKVTILPNHLLVKHSIFLIWSRYKSGHNQTQCLVCIPKHLLLIQNIFSSVFVCFFLVFGLVLFYNIVPIFWENLMWLTGITLILHILNYYCYQTDKVGQFNLIKIWLQILNCI